MSHAIHMASRRREGRASRKATLKRRLSQRLLIVCGGRKTEKSYLDGLKRAERNPSISVVIKANPRSPSEVVRHAEKIRQQSPDDFDEVWCVFDVDEFKDLREAEGLASRYKIGLAVSNPCFELWLLLHFDERTAHCSSYAALLPDLRKHLPKYDKTCLRFEDYVTGISAACVRARALEPTGHSLDVNPSTGVWQVVELMRRA
jgi:hypothetical protein